MKILTVDDAPDMLLSIRVSIQKLGHDVDTANDGLEAWNMLEKKDYDVVVSDWNMPYISGLELVKKIREVDFEHYTYIILCTGNDAQGDLVKAIDGGADDYVSKYSGHDQLRVHLQSAQRIVDLERKLLKVSG